MNKPQLNEAVANTASLEYGTPKARNEYAKDTPGQSGGDPVQEPTHASTAKYGLSVNGVPKKNGEMDKPNFDTDTGLKVEGNFSEPELVEKLDAVGKADADIDNDGDVDTSDKYLHKKRKAIKKAITKEAVDDPVEDLCDCGCDCGKKICEECGKPKAAKDVKEENGKGLGNPGPSHVTASDINNTNLKNKRKPKGAPMPTSEGFQVPEYSAFAEAMSVTLRPSKSQPGSYKVHSVGSKMKAHGGMKPGERVKDHEIDGMKDSQIRVKYHKEDTGLDEAGRWDDTTSGRRYRNMSPEEKKRQAKANELKKRARSVYKGRGDLDKVSEAMSPAERKVAAGKIFRMHQAKQSGAQKAKSAAMRDSSGYKTSDDSHLDAKPSPKPKGKRGHSEAPHIVGQLRGVIDTKGNHKGVQFKDGSTHKVSADHAKSWLAKHDAAKPSQKLGMYKHHDSHKAFKSGMSEATADQVAQARYRDKTDNPHTSAYLGKAKTGAIKGIQVSKTIPGKSLDSNKGKTAAIKKQISRRPGDYGVDGKHDPLYPANKHSVQKGPLRQKSKATAGQYEEVVLESGAKLGKVGDSHLVHADSSDGNWSSPKASGRSMGKAGKDDRHHFTHSGKTIDVNDYGDKSHVKKQVAAAGVHKDHQDTISSHIHKFVNEATYSDKQVRMAKGIAFDKRHVGGDYTGAAKKMEKIKKGLSDHPKAADALRRANEQKNFAKSLFQQEAIERRADRKTIIATDPSTGRKVVKMAPKKEIDVGKGKMA